MKRMTMFLLVAVIILGFTLPAVAQEEKLPKMISFVSKPLGVYYVMTAGFARIFEKKTGVKAVVETAPSPFAYMPFFKRKEAALALVASEHPYQAYHGIGKYEKQGKTPLAYLATGNKLPFLFWTVPSTGIKTVKNMAGKTVAIKNPGSEMMEDFVRESLKADGIWGKVKEVTRPASNTESCQMLIEKKLDVIAMPPNPQLLEVEKAVGLVPIGPREEAVKKLTETPFWARVTVKPGKFSVQKDINTAATVICIYTYKDLSDNIAYLLVKTLYESLDELNNVHRYYKEWSPKRAVENMAIPMHPGAIKYYKEQGVWTSEQEAVQKKLLAAGQ
jgi:TRAP transporter TAXI family solute receptor